MQLGPTEQARLLVFLAAELARRTRRAGLALSAPEAIAIACDEMHMAARAGASFDEVVRAGHESVVAEDLLGGVADLIAEIRVEVLLDEGTRLIVLRGLGGTGRATAASSAAVHLGEQPLTLNADLEALELDVTNHSRYPVRVSSHYPFDRVNARLTFDRKAAAGTRLDIPAGDTVRWAPGESHRVRLVRVEPTAGSS